MICLVQKKTSVPLTIPLPTVVGNALYDYLEEERKSDSRSFFITATGKDFKSSDVSYCVKKVFMAAGIRQNKDDRQGSHIFRHHLATRLLEHEVAQPVISQILGHTDPVSIQAYLSADMKHLRDCALSIEDYPLCWEVAFHA
jgi:integrase